MSQVVVVTGASGGVGRATALAFGRRGARVALVARGRDGLEAAAREIEAAGGRALPVQCDVADADAVESAAGTAEDELGPIDVWVNNAMTTVFSRVGDVTPEEFRRVTEVTYLGYVFGTVAALARMAPRRRGTIVQVGSALAYQGIPLQAAYCGAKHAIQGFTESVRAELRHDDIPVHITQVHLPGMNTPQFGWCRSHLPRQPQPVPPILQPEVAADTIVWASSAGRREVLLDVPTVKTVLGSHLAPWRMTKIVAERAYESQMTDEPTAPDRRDNLFEPVPGDPGPRGGFDDRAVDGRPAPWWGTGSILDRAAAALVGALGFSARIARSGEPHPRHAPPSS